jgi:hypothetical protein
LGGIGERKGREGILEDRGKIKLWDRGKGKSEQGGKKDWRRKGKTGIGGRRSGERK